MPLFTSQRIVKCRKLLFVTFFVSGMLTVTAQNFTKRFDIALPSSKVPNSLYKTVKLVDVRPEPENLGFVQTGAFNRKARLIAETPLAEQLSFAMDALTDKTAQGGELFLLLRQFSFAEAITGMNERGYCRFRAVLFARKGDTFQTLAVADTIITVKAVDVTSRLLEQGSKALTEFLSANLAKVPADSEACTSTEVIHFDEIEKKRLPLYTATRYKDGLYKTFAALAYQQPDEGDFIVTVSKDKRPLAVKRINQKGKPEGVSTKELYAFVKDGEPYVATAYGYYPLLKKDGDFYFEGRTKVAANANDVMMASLFFGVIGGVLASTSSSEVVEMKIDHLTGRFEKVNDVKPQ